MVPGRAAREPPGHGHSHAAAPTCSAPSGAAAGGGRAVSAAHLVAAARSGVSRQRQRRRWQPAGAGRAGPGSGRWAGAALAASRGAAARLHTACKAAGLRSVQACSRLTIPCGPTDAESSHTADPLDCCPTSQDQGGSGGGTGATPRRVSLTSPRRSSLTSPRRSSGAPVGAPSPPAQGAVLLPGFGAILSHCVVPAPPVASKAAAVLVLLERGELLLHDLAGSMVGEEQGTAPASARGAAAGVGAPSSTPKAAAAAALAGALHGPDSDAGASGHGDGARRRGGILGGGSTTGGSSSPTRKTASALPVRRGVAGSPQRYHGCFQAQPAVSAARLRVLPTEHVPLHGLQVRHRG